MRINIIGIRLVDLKAKKIITALTFLVLFLLIQNCKEHTDIEEPSPTWESLGLEGETVSTIAIDPFNENTIYAGSSSNFSFGKTGGFFKSTDGGAVWDTLIRGITVQDIDIHPFDQQILYVTAGINALTPWGILKTTDGGMSWARADTGLHLFPEEGPWVLSIVPQRPDTLYVGTGGVMGGNLYKSTDAGKVWRAVGNNVMNLSGVLAFAIDPQNKEVLYAGTADIGAITKSTDGGASWKRLDFPEVGIVYDILTHHSRPETVYAGTWWHGFYFSTNGGISWQSKNSGLPDTISIRKMVLTKRSEKIYIAANDRQKGAAYETREDNIEWTMMGNQTFTRINTIAVSKKGAIYAGAAGIYLFSN